MQLTYYDRVMTLWVLMAQGQTAPKASHYWTAVHTKSSFTAEMDDGKEHSKMKAEALI